MIVVKVTLPPQSTFYDSCEGNFTPPQSTLYDSCEGSFTPSKYLL